MKTISKMAISMLLVFELLPNASVGYILGNSLGDVPLQYSEELRNFDAQKLSVKFDDVPANYWANISIPKYLNNKILLNSLKHRDSGEFFIKGNSEMRY